MTSIHNFRAARGFSLLEVLVAVVIMSVGLLALASLQLSVYRSSADTKAQTIALGLAKDRLESMRSFTDLTAYQNLTSSTENIADSNGSLGGIDFTRATTVSRFVYDSGSGSYVGGVDNLASDATLASTSCGVSGGSGYTCVPGKDFKRIAVVVGWVDATGASRSVALEDAVSALAPLDSAKITKTSLSTVPRPAVVRIYNPGATAGVIPIAIGGGSNTAATNPTPEVAGRNTASAHVVETRFNVLTYSGLNGGTATAQSRVETAIAGCQCDLASTTTRGFRPTYWDGEKYTVPEAVTSYYAPSEAATGLTVAQSNLCTICCRDHHDPSGVAGAKFSPRRGTHSHFTPDTITATTTALDTVIGGGTVATSGRYVDACRVIRVNGFFRVAADTYNDHADLLQTNSDESNNEQALSTLPVASAASTITSTYRYAGLGGFVLTYMGNRFVDPASNTNQATYNTASVGGEPALALHPDPLVMSKADVISRWHHLRGLYVDYLEAAAVAKMNAAKVECAAMNTATPNSCDLSTRILALLPFTSINLTEIAEWRAFRETSSGSGNGISFGTPYFEDEAYTHLFTANNDFITSVNVTDPVRGAVEPGTALPGSRTNGNSIDVEPKVRAEIYSSNSGLALLALPVHTDETIKVDTQNITLSGGAPNASSASFKVNVPVVTQVSTNAYTFSESTAAYPKFSGSPTIRCSYASKNGGGYKKPNPFTCATKSGGQSHVITAAKYNYQTTASVSETLTCTKADGTAPISHTSTNVAAVCKNYQLSSVTGVPTGKSIVLGTVVNDGTIGESTAVTITNVVAGDVFTFNLVPQGTTTATSTCTYEEVNGSPVVTIVAGACP